MSVQNTLSSHFKAEFVGRIVAAGTGGLLTVLLARLLDPNGYGLLFLAISIFSLLEIFSRLGIAKSTARYLVEYKEKDPSQIPHILRVSIFYNIITIIGAVLVLIISYQFISDLLGEPGLIPFLLLGIVFLIPHTLIIYVREILQGLEEIKLSAAIHAFNQSSKLVAAVGMVLVGFGALGALGGIILADIVSVTLGLALLFSRFYHSQEAAASIELGLSRRLGEYAIPLTVTNAAAELDQRVDILLIGFFLNPIAVSYYYIAKQMIDFAAMPADSLGFILSPRLGREKAEDNTQQATQIYEDALVYLLLFYIPSAAGLLIVSDPLVRIIFGLDYIGAIPVLQILAVYLVCSSVVKITSGPLDFMGYARARAIAKGGTSVLNFILNILLIPTRGVIGAAIATVFTYSIYTFATIYLIQYEFNLHWKYIIQQTAIIILITIIMSAVVMFILNLAEGPLSLIGAVFIGVLIWGLLALLLGFLDVHNLRSIM